MDWTDISCNGANDGTAQALLTGGSGNFAYDWSTGATTPSVSNLEPGVHYVNVSDLTLGCNVFGLVEILEPQILSVDPTSTPVGCFGGNDGIAEANASGGTAPYTIIWSNGQIGPLATGLIAGNYTVTVTDTNNCSTFGVINVGTSSSFLISFDSLQHVSCTGASDGTVVANATGGSGIYQYLWNTGDTLAQIDSLQSGYYSVAVSDTNGCVAIDSVLIDEPMILSATVLSLNPTSCFNTCDGSSTVQASGGTAPYNYLWDVNTGSQTGPEAVNLCPDTFIVSVIDFNGCGVLTSAIITAPDTIILSDSIVSASCFSYADGSVFTEVVNAVNPITYQWADTNYVLSQTGSELLNVPSGDYFVHITDSLGCQLLDTFHIAQPDLLTTSLFSISAICHGDTTGSIQQNVVGGTSPYSFLWNNGDTLQDLTGLGAGTYSVQILDANQCSYIDSIIVTEPDPLEVFSLINDVSCYQASDGSISVQAEGGNGSYQYLWNTGQTGDDLVGLMGGIYTVTVTDALGCNSSRAHEVLVTNEECINIPTAFTPNSDGLNDTWVLRNIDLYPGNTVKILNRWGQVLFESTGYMSAWDGRYNGSDPAGRDILLCDRSE